MGSGALHSHANVPSRTCASRRTRAGLIASQKAVHTHPDHVSSWAVLAASVAAHNVAATQEGLGRDRSSLGARISQFVESTGIELLRKFYDFRRLFLFFEIVENVSWTCIAQFSCRRVSSLL